MQLKQRFVLSSTNFNIRKVSHGIYRRYCIDLVEQERTKHLRIGYINAQSCRNKTEEIFDLIIEKNNDILLITETWLAQHGDEKHNDIAWVCDILNSTQQKASLPQKT